MKKLLGFLYVMLLFFTMAGPAFAWFGFNGGCPGCNCYKVPEPSTMLLLGSGIVGLVVFGRKKIKN